MRDPTIPELLRAGFQALGKINNEAPVRLEWPEDIDGQARCIRHLSDMATNPGWPHEYRVWAFDKLKEIARDYRERATPGSVPLEMLSWSFGVVSGAFEPPKRPSGRPGSRELSNMIDNRAIAVTVAWLIGRGESRTKATELVGDAVNLSAGRVGAIFDEAKAQGYLRNRIELLR
ncbi:MAG: hypothetical protein OXG35_13130 [Acidobacteria bacterium]|nr:hypothetical protein [Acidobacteriota bacterium]